MILALFLHLLNLVVEVQLGRIHIQALQQQLHLENLHNIFSKKMQRRLTFHILLLITYLISVSNSVLIGQNETNNWYFGNKAAMSFSINPPVAVLNSAMVAGEACACISDAAGNLLFYSNGVNVWDNSHNLMANGSGILGNTSSTQGAVIAKSPSLPLVYYLFTLDQLGQSNGLRYSVIDMSLSAGQGSITSKNNLIYTPSCEKMTLVKHCNGRDTWIVTHEYNSANFRSYLLDNNGLSSNPVISNIGPIIANPSASAGYLKASPNGRKLAMVVPGNAAPNGSVVTFDFDNTNGVISNSLTLFNSEFIYGCEFSPDGTKLYASDFGLNQIFQWQLCAGNNSAVINSMYTVNTGTQSTIQAPYAMQLAKDGKIYFIHGPNNYLSVINNPNNPGATMNVSFAAVSIAPKTSMMGLPNFINNFNAPILPSAFTFSSTCSTVSFTPPIQPSQTVSTTCTTTNYPTSAHFWDFGDVNSGATNSSTLNSPSHNFSNIGTYTVKLILTSPCRSDTVKQIINITSINPVVSVSGPTSICAGETASFSVTGNFNFNWSNGSTSNKMNVSPNTSSTYTLITTNTITNCSSKSTINLTVNKCLHLFDQLPLETFIRIYPNPTSDILKFDNLSTSTIKLLLTNQINQVLFSSTLSKGYNEIDVSKLLAGIYYLQIQIDNSIFYKKCVIE